MKKSVIVMVAAMAVASAFAEPIWTYVSTEGVDGAKSTAASDYTAYYCTKAAAAEIFKGRTDVQSISAYLSAAEWLYEDAMKQLEGGKGVKMDFYDLYQGEYTFSKYLKESLNGDYIALVAYTGEVEGETGMHKDTVRVFSATAAADGSLSFDPAAGEGKASEWATAPEPTSALLSLFALAALALRRKQR